MHSLESKIESVLFFKNEPISIKELVKILNVNQQEVEKSVKNLQEFYKNRGIVIISDDENIIFGTHPDLSELIDNLGKEELSRELGRAGLETLALVLYRGLISRREIDHIRGVNSSFILRSLMIRGLIERSEGTERSYSYKATLKLLEHLGITRREDLPEYETAFKKINEFEKTTSIDQNE